MAVLDQVPVRTVQFGRVLLTALAAVLWLVGWTPAAIARAVAAAASWSAAAVRVGWVDARRGGG